MGRVNQLLFEQNKEIEGNLLNAAEKFYREEDLRWFFSYSHGKITQQINRNIDLFENPNELTKLNMHFAKAYLKAVNGKPSKEWKVAFFRCSVINFTSTFGSPSIIQVSKTEMCGALMAKVHIELDLSNALKEVGCISTKDYGNMLEFVRRGSREALIKLRGSKLGNLEADLMVETFDYVKFLRDHAYEDVCHVPVPDIEQKFIKKIHPN